MRCKYFNDETTYVSDNVYVRESPRPSSIAYYSN